MDAQAGRVLLLRVLFSGQRGGLAASDATVAPSHNLTLQNLSTAAGLGILFAEWLLLPSVTHQLQCSQQ